jgi:hypothetical protein
LAWATLSAAVGRWATTAWQDALKKESTFRLDVPMNPS